MDRAKRERDERTTAKCPEAAGRIIKGGRESRLSSINNTRCNCTATAPWPRAVDCKEADRRTMEETRGGECRTHDRRSGRWMEGATERVVNACERQQGGKIERDG